MHKIAFVVFACICIDFSSAQAQIPAFPGAEGFGAVSVGGRGGDVYIVNSLQDTGNPGTLRHAIDTAPASGRTIVFNRSGNIHLNNSISVDNPKITIAGQTAPGQGITLSGGTLWLEDDDLIVRHIRDRLGATPANGEDSISITNGNRIIVDHSSASWSTDEVSSVTNNSTNNTIQWSLITEPLNSQNHARSSLFRPGANVSAGTPTEFNLSVHHNLYAHGSDRNPVMATYNGHTLNIDFRNNVIFDWRNQATHTGDPTHYINVNFVSNFYVAGLTTRSDLVANPTIFSSGSTDTVIYYNTDNLVDATRTDGLHNGIWDPTAIGGPRTEVGTPFAYPHVTTESANDAYDSVLAYAGAFFWDRDPVDDRVVTDVHEISAPQASVRNQSGMMLTTEADVGGLPTLPVVVRAADWDVDNDGMPGWWEEKHGLDPNVANNNADFDNDLYTDLEEYINEVGAFPAPTDIVFDGSLSTRYARTENWDINWQPSHFDTAVIASGTAVVDAVGQHAGTIKVAPQSGQVAVLNISSGWLEVANSLEIATAGADGDVNLSGGKLRVGTMNKGAGGNFNFSGGTLAADLVLFDLVNNGGTIAPGDSPGMTQVDGNLTINSGILEIELGGLTAGSEFDHLEVTGDVLLGGSLDVSLIDSFTLAANQTFEILDVDGTLTGQFAGLAEGALVGNFGEDLYITYQGGDGNDVELTTVTPFLPEDLNMDGFVDSLDLGILLGNWNQSTTPDQGELNGTPPVDSLDLGLLLGAWNPPASAATSVPEPSSLVLILMVSLGLASKTRSIFMA